MSPTAAPSSSPGTCWCWLPGPLRDRENLSLQEIVIEKGHKWLGCALRQIPTRSNALIVMIKRGNETIIPSGGTTLQTGDTLVIAQSNTTQATA